MIERYRIPLVDMGHTHYNELANDGHAIYAATRSTGQIEEGGVGFAITTIDRGVVSWKFHELGQWPLVKIIAPVDRDLIIDPASPLHVVRGEIEIRARVWGGDGALVSCRIDGAGPSEMQRIGTTDTFRFAWRSANVPDGVHVLTVATNDCDGPVGSDTIDVLTSQSGTYASPARSPRDRDNAVPARPLKGLLGTRLGPNANGRKW